MTSRARKDQAGRDFVSKPSAGSYGSAGQSYGANPLGSLTRAEQVVCGRLILRQLDHGPRIQQALAKYGPQGTVRLCSARAFWLFEVVFGVVAAALAISGAGRFAAPFVILFLLAFALAVMRSISGVRAGKRWRSENPRVQRDGV
jgi:hypothetical protein